MSVMTTPLVLTRRAFLADLGRGAFALTVVGMAACAPGASGSSTAGPVTSPEPTGGTSSTSGPAASASDTPASPSGSAAPASAVTWERVNLGFVSAYILVRGGEAAVVDTGVVGSEGGVEASLKEIGLDWSAVGHVVLTHMHPDHAGSAAAVLDKAPDATGYAGAEDIPAIAAPRPLTAVADNDRVFDLRIVTTPGHTAGHIAVLDEVGGILVAGDALNTRNGLQGSDPDFTDDPVAAQATLVKLGKLTFETLLVGHGEPIASGASAQVAALAG